MSIEFLSERVRNLETEEPPVVYDFSNQNVADPPSQADANAAFGATAAQLRDGWSGIIDDNGAGTDVWLAISKNDTWHFVKVVVGGGGVTGTGVADQVAYWTGANTIAGNAKFTRPPGTGLLTVQSNNDANAAMYVRANSATHTAFLQQWQSSAGVPYVVVGPPQIVGAGADFYFAVNGAMPAIPVANVSGTFFVVTSAGNAAFTQTALDARLTSGYTGASSTRGVFCDNNAAGTAGTLLSNNPPDGNSGCSYVSSSSTAGYNYGCSGLAYTGNISIGVLGRGGYSTVQRDKNGAAYLGVVGFARNNGVGGATHCGVYAGLDIVDPTFASAALIADNDTATDPIFLGRDNGTVVFRIDDGSRVGINENTPAAQLHVDQNSATGAIPVVYMNQEDQDNPFFTLDGDGANDSSLNLSDLNGDGVVDGPKNASATAGWTFVGMARIHIEDDTNVIADGDYWFPFYTLDTP